MSGRPRPQARSSSMRIGLRRGRPPCPPTTPSELLACQLRPQLLGRHRPHTQARTPRTHC
eukprot:10688668-Alexandrium_andersonii.AAC.1